MTKQILKSLSIGSAMIAAILMIAGAGHADDLQGFPVKMDVYHFNRSGGYSLQTAHAQLRAGFLGDKSICLLDVTDLSGNTHTLNCKMESAVDGYPILKSVTLEHDEASTLSQWLTGRPTDLPRIVMTKESKAQIAAGYAMLVAEGVAAPVAFSALTGTSAMWLTSAMAEFINGYDSYSDPFSDVNAVASFQVVNDRTALAIAVGTND